MLITAILTDIQHVLQQYGPFSFLLSLLILFVYILCTSWISKKHLSYMLQKSWVQYSRLYIFIIYGVMIVAITLLSRPEGSRVGISLRLFATFMDGAAGLVYPVENILLFIPMGILLPLIWLDIRSLPRIIGMGLAISLLIELIQLITQRGYFQTDDILLNILGALIGYILFCGFISIFYKIRKHHPM